MTTPGREFRHLARKPTNRALGVAARLRIGPRSHRLGPTAPGIAPRGTQADPPLRRPAFASAPAAAVNRGGWTTAPTASSVPSRAQERTEEAAGLCLSRFLPLPPRASLPLRLPLVAVASGRRQPVMPRDSGVGSNASWCWTAGADARACACLCANSLCI
jgi:hypothetical protein